MKKAVKELRSLCKLINDIGHRTDAMSILDDLDRWANAQLPIEELDEISEGISHHIVRMLSAVKLNSAMAEVLEMGREQLGIPDCLRIDTDALEEIKAEIMRLEKKKEIFERLRTLYAIEKMTEMPDA